MPRPSRWPEIVDAAARAFREKGFDATSLEEIAADVGIWKGSLYHYIDSKEDLLFAVVKEPADRILAELRELLTLDLPPAEKVRRAAHTHVTVLHDHFVYASVYLEEIAGRHRSAEWSAMDREYLSCLEKVIADGRDQGDFDAGIDPRIASLALIGSFNWLTHWYRPDGPLSPREIADRFSDIFLAGMLSRRASATVAEPKAAAHARRTKRASAG